LIVLRHWAIPCTSERIGEQMKKKTQNKTDRIVGLIDQCLADVPRLWERPRYLHQLYEALKEEVEERERIYYTQCPERFRAEALKVLEKFKTALEYLHELAFNYNREDPGIPFTDAELIDALQWVKERLIAEDWRRR